MNVLLVCPYALARSGGVQTHVRDVATALNRLGHRAVILAPAQGGGEEKDLVQVGRPRMVGFNETAFELTLVSGAHRRRLDDLLSSRSFDVVHYHAVWVPFLPLQVMRRTHCASVATFHDSAPDTFSGHLSRYTFRLLNAFLVPRLGATIAVSRAAACNIPDGTRPQARIIPPCLNLARFSPSAATRASDADGVPRILFLGRLDRRKGIMTLLEAYQRLIRAGHRARLLVAGTGQDHEHAVAFARTHCVPGIEFLGHVDERDKPALLAACDVFCAPSLHGESFGLVLVEAMASGKPVVAAANPGYRDVLSGPLGRFLFEPGNPDALAQKLHPLLGSARLREEMGRLGIQAACAYDCKSVVPELLDAYRDAIASKAESTG